MTHRTWLRAQAPWVRGGIIGVALCSFLFVLYGLVYFPLAKVIFHEQNDESDAILIAPIVTGHALPVLVHFFVEGSSIATTLCTETQAHCAYWTSEYQEGSVPWMTADGNSGYCVQQETSPAPTCVNRVERISAVGSIVALELAYFIIGAGIATTYKRFRN